MSNLAGGWKPARRKRSSSRRRQARAEAEARCKANADIFALQQKLLAPAASQTLLDAAVKLLQASDYEAVVIERALEGICGYPSCSKPAKSVDVGHKWALDRATGEVVPAADVGSFCSSACSLQSKKLAARFEPDPAYCRPASAIAASRQAVSQATHHSHDVEQEKKSVAEVPEAVESSAPAAQFVESATTTSKASLPPVRTKTVVRFSRDTKVCDGPRECVSPEGLPVQMQKAGPESDECEAAAQQELPNTDVSLSIGGADVEQVLKVDSGLLEIDPLEQVDCMESLPTSPFVRAWGVLSEWCTPLACEVMAYPDAYVPPNEETASSSTGRRHLLTEILSERLPAELCSLGEGLHRVTQSLGVHQPLPPVTETALYDLLAILLLQAIYHGEVSSGERLVDVSIEAILRCRVQAAAHAYGVPEAQLAILEGITRTHAETS